MTETFMSVVKWTGDFGRIAGFCDDGDELSDSIT